MSDLRFIDGANTLLDAIERGTHRGKTVDVARTLWDRARYFASDLPGNPYDRMGELIDFGYALGYNLPVNKAHRLTAFVNDTTPTMQTITFNMPWAMKSAADPGAQTLITTAAEDGPGDPATCQKAIEFGVAAGYCAKGNAFPDPPQKGPIVLLVRKSFDSSEPRDSAGRWTIVRMDARGPLGPMVFYGAEHQGKVYLSSHSAPGRDRVRHYDPNYWKKVDSKEIGLVLPHAGKRTAWGTRANALATVMKTEWQAKAKNEHIADMEMQSQADIEEKERQSRLANAAKNGYGINPAKAKLGDIVEDAGDLKRYVIGEITPPNEWSKTHGIYVVPEADYGIEGPSGTDPQYLKKVGHRKPITKALDSASQVPPKLGRDFDYDAADQRLTQEMGKCAEEYEDARDDLSVHNAKMEAEKKEVKAALAKIEPFITPIFEGKTGLTPGRARAALDYLKLQMKLKKIEQGAALSDAATLPPGKAKLGGAVGDPAN